MFDIPSGFIKVENGTFYGVIMSFIILYSFVSTKLFLKNWKFKLEHYKVKDVAVTYLFCIMSFAVTSYIAFDVGVLAKRDDTFWHYYRVHCKYFIFIAITSYIGIFFSKNTYVWIKERKYTELKKILIILSAFNLGCSSILIPLYTVAGLGFYIYLKTKFNL